MPRKSAEPLKKTTINLRDGDSEAIADFFPRQKPQAVIRKLISQFVDNIRARHEPQDFNITLNELERDDN